MMIMLVEKLILIKNWKEFVFSTMNLAEQIMLDTTEKTYLCGTASLDPCFDDEIEELYGPTYGYELIRHSDINPDFIRETVTTSKILEIRMNIPIQGDCVEFVICPPDMERLRERNPVALAGDYIHYFGEEYNDVDQKLITDFLKDLNLYVPEN